MSLFERPASEDPELFGSTKPADWKAPDPDRERKQDKITPKSDYSSRKKKPADHSKRTCDFWAKLGYFPVKVEAFRVVRGMTVKTDLCGCFDYWMVKPGEPDVLVQVSSRGDTRSHLNKMLGQEPDYTGTPRRLNVEKMLACGKRVVIHWWEQPEGHGKAWAMGLLEVNRPLIEAWENNKRLDLKATGVER